MAATDKVNKFARKVWLAGLGAYGRSSETVTEKIDKAYEESNQLFNDLVTKGAEIQTNLEEKIKKQNMFEQKVDEVREKLGLNSSVSEQQIDDLTAKVDALTEIVTKLAEQKLADLNAEKAAAEKASVVETKAAETKAAETKAADEKAAEKPTKTRKTKAKATEA